MVVPYLDLGAQYAPIKSKILKRIEELLDNGQFILGEQVEEFEARFASLCGTKHAVGVANGTDALMLVLQGYGIGAGDEVICPSHSFLATASAICMVGATPVFADVASDMNINPSSVEQLITKKSKAIIAVHLSGTPADMDALMAIAESNNLKVIEDAAQAVGAEYRSKITGNLGHSACFSLHPLKNLSAGGDGGVITTNDDGLANWLILARNHGLKSRDECEFWSMNSRLDAMQAAILNVKFGHLEAWNNRRREIAEMYNERLGGVVKVPEYPGHSHPVFHTYIIRLDRRDELQAFLKENGVESKVHYPLAIHQQKAAKNLGYESGSLLVTEETVNTILSLPIYPELTGQQVEYVIDKVIAFHE